MVRNAKIRSIVAQQMAQYGSEAKEQLAELREWEAIDFDLE